MASLLRDLASYREAKDPAERTRIGERMLFPDPIVWMTYKREAYRGTPEEIATVGAFLAHCEQPGDICEKRFRFLRERLGSWEWESETPLEAVIESVRVRALVDDQAFLADWRAHEYFREEERVAKWESYP